VKKLICLCLALIFAAGCGILSPNENRNNSDLLYGWFEDYISASVGTFCMYNTADTIPYNMTKRCTARLYTQLLSDGNEGYFYTGNLATSAPVAADDSGTVWNISLRRGYLWQNGEEITADDFIYSMMQLLDPKAANSQASILSSGAYAPIKNAKEYFLGKCAWEDVGFKKVDGYTIQLVTDKKVSSELIMRTFETPYTMLVYKPLYEQYRNENGTSAYGTSLESFMSAGPFFLTDWEPDAKYTFTTNPDYIYADRYSIEGINVSVISNSATATELFLSGKLDYLSITYAEWEMFEDDPRTYEYWGNSLQYMFVNLGNPNQNGLLGNLDFRKALYYGADRVALAETIGAIPATRIAKKSVVGNPDTGTAFVEMEGSKDYIDDGYKVYDPTLANEYLTKAFEQCKLTDATMEIYYSETSTHSKPATEILDSQYEEVFGGKLNITLRQVPSAQQFSLRRWNPENPTAFDANIGSITSLNDSPHYTFQYYTSFYSPPRFYYSNPQFDAIYEKATASEDHKEIVSLCQQLEKILLEDMVVVPLYELPSKALFSQRIHLPGDGYINNFGFGYEYAIIAK